MTSIATMFSMILVAILIASTQAFQPSHSRIQSTKLQMVSGNKATFGIFAPAVVAAKFILGEAKLNKVRVTSAIRVELRIRDKD
jgi:fucose permease